MAPDIPGSGTEGPDGQTVNGAALLCVWGGNPASGLPSAATSGMGSLHGDDSHALEHGVYRINGRTLTRAWSIQHEIQVGRKK